MYTHKVQYYETDKMAITHHSNYIRWMEEARVDFLEKIGFGFDTLEAKGIMSPVLEIHSVYKKPSVFAEEIDIDVFVKEFKGLKVTIGYEMKNKKGEAVLEGSSVHCFMTPQGRPVRVEKDFPDFYNALMSHIR